MIQPLRSRLSGMRWRLAVAGCLVALAACVGPKLIDSANGPAAGEPIAKVVATLPQDFRPTSAAWSPDGKYLAVTGSSGTRTINIWDVEQKKIVQSMELPVPPPLSWHALAWSPDGRLLASCAGASELTLRVWNTRTWQVVKDFSNSDRVYACRTPLFSWDSQQLVIGQQNGIAVYSTQDWSVTKRWKIPTGTPRDISHVALQPNTSVLAIAVNGYWNHISQGRVLFWDYLADDEPRSDFRPYPELSFNVVSVAFSPDGQHLATSTTTGAGIKPNQLSVRLWRMFDRTLLSAPLDGKDHGEVVGLAYTPNGKYLIAGHSERAGTIHVLDATTGTVLGAMHSPPFVACITVKPDSTLFASCSGGQLTVWSLKH